MKLTIFTLPLLLATPLAEAQWPLVVVSTQSQTNFWQKLSGPYGGDVSLVQFTPPNNIFVATGGWRENDLTASTGLHR